MLDRLSRVFAGGGGLLRAESQLAALALKRALGAAVAFAIAGVLAAVALLTLGVAGVVILAGEVGWPIAAAIVGGALLALSIIVLVAGRMAMSKRAPADPERLEREADRCKQEMRDAVTPDDPEPDAPGASPGIGGGTVPKSMNELKDAATTFISKHPVETASAAFAVLALVGPFRTLRLLGRGAALAGLVGSIASNLGDSKDAEPHENGRARAAKPHAVPQGPPPAAPHGV